MAVSEGSQPSESHTGTETEDGGSILPRSRLFWFAVVAGVVLILIGMFVVTGPMAAIMGVWGISLLVAAVAGYGLFRLWFRLGR